MKLVDLDKWQEKNVAFLGFGLHMNLDMVVDTLKACTVDAIPISYLQERLENFNSKAYKNCLQTVILDYLMEAKNNER